MSTKEFHLTEQVAYGNILVTASKDGTEVLIRVGDFCLTMPPDEFSDFVAACCAVERKMVATT